jgi:hypothetical protein
MEKVTGIGGLFFCAHDSAVLAQWYQEHLGVARREDRQRLGTSRRGRPRSVHLQSPARTSAIPSRCGWLTFASGMSTR